MDEKISLEAITQYAEAYSDKVLEGFFSKKEQITGQEILSLCNVQQVNLFIVRELFKSWKDETRKLQSPYFNYELPEVKDAMETLMSLLSKNISISRNYFTPLLKRAVSQALLVIFDPYDFFSIMITGKDNKLDIAPFREEIKYLKVNKAPLEKMLQKLDEKGMKEVSGNEAFSIMDQILEEVSFTPEDVEDYIAKFSAVVPLNANKFFVPKEEETAPPAYVAPTTPLPPSKPEPVPAPIKSKPEPMIVPPKPPVRLTLNEALTRQSGRSLVDNFQRIGKIRDNLTINQKFMFTKVLFHGDFELFSQAIEHLDKLENKKSALRYIQDEHAGTWNADSDEYLEFMELVEKRFP
ncbi:MAG: hypothetical protein ABIS36_11595 [Chryseolinea sp.]